MPELPWLADVSSFWQDAVLVVLSPGMFLAPGLVAAVVTPAVLTLGVTQQASRREAIVSALLRALGGDADNSPRHTPVSSRQLALTAVIGLTVALGFAAAQIVHATGRLVPGGVVAEQAHAAERAELESEIRRDIQGLREAAGDSEQLDTAVDRAVASLRAVAPAIDSDWIRYAVIGFLGAYFSLWRETIARMRTGDLSEAALANMARTLVAGTLLGAVLPASLTDADGLTGDALAFLVGAFPGPAETLLRRLADRAFGRQPDATVPRPLSKLSGMTPDVLERLQEEGITDAQHLCYRNPFALIALLPYAPRQIVDWIDEALLFRYLPTDAFDKRGAAGVTGAVDLLELLAPSEGGGTGTSPLPLAAAFGVEEDVLVRVTHLMGADRQALLLRRLEALDELSDPALVPVLGPPRNPPLKALLTRIWRRRDTSANTAQPVRADTASGTA